MTMEGEPSVKHAHFKDCMEPPRVERNKEGSLSLGAARTGAHFFSYELRKPHRLHQSKVVKTG